jgi:hypothetical protein
MGRLSHAAADEPEFDSLPGLSVRRRGDGSNQALSVEVTWPPQGSNALTDSGRAMK